MNARRVRSDRLAPRSPAWPRQRRQRRTSEGCPQSSPEDLWLSATERPSTNSNRPQTRHVPARHSLPLPPSVLAPSALLWPVHLRCLEPLLNDSLVFVVLASRVAC